MNENKKEAMTNKEKKVRDNREQRRKNKDRATNPCSCDNERKFVPNPHKRYIPNGYAMPITITDRMHAPVVLLQNLKEAHENKSNEGVPFYALKRFYMKTICNMINDLVDIVYYTKNFTYLSDDTDEHKIETTGSVTRKRVMEYIMGESVTKAYRRFELAANRENAGITLLYSKSDDEVLHTITPEGDLITWSREKRPKHVKHPVDVEYTIIEKDSYEEFIEWLDSYCDSPYYPISAHQWAAVMYLSEVYNGTLFDHSNHHHH